MNVCVIVFGLLMISMGCSAGPYRRNSVQTAKTGTMLKRLTSLMGALKKRGADCPNGDVDWCADYITDADIGWQCNLPDVASACCEKCQGQTDSGGCGDVAPYCKTMFVGDCYDSGIQEMCCATCAAAATGGSGCEYGDKADWCANYQSSDCSDIGSETCCALCG